MCPDTNSHGIYKANGSLTHSAPCVSFLIWKKKHHSRDSTFIILDIPTRFPGPWEILHYAKYTCLRSNLGHNYKHLEFFANYLLLKIMRIVSNLIHMVPPKNSTTFDIIVGPGLPMYLKAAWHWIGLRIHHHHQDTSPTLD